MTANDDDGTSTETPYAQEDQETRSSSSTLSDGKNNGQIVAQECVSWNYFHSTLGRIINVELLLTNH